MLIFGIDPSLNSTGYCILQYQNNIFSSLEHETIKHKSGGEHYEKIINVYKILHGKINTFKPQIISIEDTFVNNNPSTSLKLGMIRGACLSASSAVCAEIFEYETRLVKKIVTGNGSADKDQVLYMVQRFIPNFIPKTMDESDAAAVAIASGILYNSQKNQK